MRSESFAIKLKATTALCAALVFFGFFPATPAQADAQATSTQDSRVSSPSPVLEGSAARAQVLEATASASAAASSSRFDCLVEPRERIEISSQEAGVVAQTFVDRGDAVSVGQLLAKLTDTVERAEFEVAKSRAEAVGELSAKRAQAEYEARRLRRHRQAIAQNAISAQQADEIRSTHEVAVMTLKSAEEEADRRRRELERAAAKLAQREIRSTIDGVVLEKNRSPGEAVDQEALFTLVALDPLNVEAFLPIALWSRLAKGDQAMVFLVGESRPLAATVEVIDPVADAASGTFKLRLVLPNPESSILAGAKCSVAFSSL